MSKVLIIAPGTNIATVQDVEPTLETLQGLVGGLIQPITLGNGVLWCNEEGKLQGLPHNWAADKLLVAAGVPLMVGDFIVGTAVIQGPSTYDEDNDVEVHHDVSDEVLGFVPLAGIELQEPGVPTPELPPGADTEVPPEAPAE